jgi:hypothetical protein
MVSPAQFQEPFTNVVTLGMDIALRRRGSVRLHIESPNTGMAGLCIGTSHPGFLDVRFE